MPPSNGWNYDTSMDMDMLTTNRADYKQKTPDRMIGVDVAALVDDRAKALRRYQKDQGFNSRSTFQVPILTHIMISQFPIKVNNIIFILFKG